MTTAPPALVPRSGNAALARGAGPLLGVVVVTSVLGGLLADRPGFLGALLGSAVVAVVCLGGILVVNTVAWLAPQLSLAFALTTYLLQLMVLTVFFLAVARGLRDGAAVDVRALSLAAMAVVAVWVAVLLRTHVTTRIPVYDLPAPAAEGQVRQ